ncbi:EpsG family protein [Bacillaceae bacterium IKA-2]|nr:EpsG family protein [Bacillaceae bacterium IKA-2]
MTILWYNLAVVFTLSFLSRLSATYVQKPNTVLPIKPNKLLVFGTIMTLVMVSGLRTNIGDTYFYRHSYEITNFTWDYIKSEKDLGFGLLQMLLKMISTDPQLLIFTTALITNLLIVLVLYKYSRLLEISLYVYITSGLFLVSMNGIRQFLAAAIIFAATKYILDGSWKKFFLVVIVASTFHQSALVFIPIYFLVRSKAWTKTTISLLLVAVILVIGYNQFTELLFTVIGESQYGNYRNFTEQGANKFRIAVYGAPLIIAYLGREKLRLLFPKSDYIVNLSLLNVVFMIIASQNWIFARFTIYFGLYQLILVAWVIKLFREKDQKLIYFALLVCYLIYFYYEHVISLNIIYRSNFFSF